MNRSSARLRYGALFVAGLAASLVVQEISVRLALPVYDPRGHLRFEKSDGVLPPLGPRLAVQRQIKNTGDFNVTVRFNRHGLRDSKDILESRSGDYFVIGDSFAFGWGVEAEDRFSNRLQGALGRRVYNAAVPVGIDGYGRMLAYLEGLGVEVSRIIVTVNMETEIGNYGETAEPGTPPPVRRLPGLKVFLMEHSAFYFMATSVVHDVAPLRAIAVKLGLIAEVEDVIRGNRFDSRSIDSTARRIGQITDGYDATVVLIPTLGLWEGENRAQERRVHDAFASRLRDMGLRVVDPRQAFEKSGNARALHFRRDGHWTAAGHAVVAATIAEALRASGGARPVR